ncbi:MULTISPECIES: dethiobiotin synthase [Campylobacter]|uniref:dethiobiotin synthase n=1 Tax=Campylobacter TaxID=194 RepID=UPI000A3338F7|nr:MULTISPECIES: dethiobiotin synthase [unclassified Campylobacter]MCR8679647.1 dethiobiotin synthase [Campylobacter sp. RM19072]MCR8696824.1 dethiobiotin synthase [Campylobacter sp. RM19073]MEE3704621.1 dethiobiotin synthase [Campylobacter sp. CX2-8023-23]
MSKKIFITGTSTDVGKSYISALVVKKMREFGLNVGYFKPVSSGNLADDPLDVKFVREFAKIELSYSQMSAYNFIKPYSPHLSAKNENKSVNMDTIISKLNNLDEICDFMVVEGAGGVICPLRYDDEKIMLLDLIKALNLSVIIVSDAALGAINQTGLTSFYLRQNGVDIKGVVLNNFDENCPICVDNKKMINELFGLKILSCVKRDELSLDISKDEILNIFN